MRDLLRIARTAAYMPSQQEVKSWNPDDEPEDTDQDVKDITNRICRSGRKRQGQEHQAAGGLQPFGRNFLAAKEAFEEAQVKDALMHLV